jgi:argininosuccinate synthase
VGTKALQGVSIMSDKINKVVLAYSGGLDTSIILKWLQDEYQCEVVAFAADLGQGKELEEARVKAENFGIKEIYVEDLKEEFVRDYVFPMYRANALYEGVYHLGTSIARPLIAKRQIEIANETGAEAVSHGSTGKGNDQVRFELGYYAKRPDIKIIAPWREWDLNSRDKLLAYADKHNIPVPRDKRGESPYSMDRNLLHISFEGKVLEDPFAEPDEDMFVLSVSPENAPDKPTYIELSFQKGDPVAINGEQLSPANMLARLNDLGGANGIGRLDLVENRYVGMKSRGVYETPGGTILGVAHRALESLTLDREVAHLKDELMPRYATLIYNGYWFSPERTMLQTMIDASQTNVNGVVRLKLYKGNVIVVGRKSEKSLFDPEIATFEDDKGAYDQGDATGFIKLNALRIRIDAMLRKGS